jgi:hypothetical protein
MFHWLVTTDKWARHSELQHIPSWNCLALITMCLWETITDNNGAYISKYKITVPKELKEYE